LLAELKRLLRIPVRNDIFSSVSGSAGQGGKCLAIAKIAGSIEDAILFRKPSFDFEKVEASFDSTPHDLTSFESKKCPKARGSLAFPLHSRCSSANNWGATLGQRLIVVKSDPNIDFDVAPL
jgi:hypothetical protein